ncbi:PglD-related sugar-binding protein [Blastococcus sp. SYSU DS0616]
MSSPEGCSDARGRPPELAIIGTGGHGRELLDIVTAINSITPTWTFVGFLGRRRPDPSLLPQRAATWLGPVSALADMDVRYIVGIGDSTARADVDRLASGWRREPATRVHPRASVGSDVESGSGGRGRTSPPTSYPTDESISNDGLLDRQGTPAAVGRSARSPARPLARRHRRVTTATCAARRQSVVDLGVRRSRPVDRIGGDVGSQAIAEADAAVLVQAHSEYLGGALDGVRIFDTRGVLEGDVVERL